MLTKTELEKRKEHVKWITKTETMGMSLSQLESLHEIKHTEGESNEKKIS